MISTTLLLSSCWKLNVLFNKWKKVGGFQTGRFRAASVAVNEKMIVLGGRDVDGLDIIGFEVRPHIIVFLHTNVKSIYISKIKILSNVY